MKYNDWFESGFEIHPRGPHVLPSEGRHSEAADEREGYKRVERVRGSFYRRFSMPDTANAEAVTAKSKDGVLEIVIPKQEKLQPKRIQVES